ncbi:MAG: hypothetical protein KGJ37_03150 [Verrucomicrobiota bacterium]|nr:hypothetical protein [Verrucomicrobiota bacterium]
MQTEAIIATLLAAAAFLKRPIQDVTAQSLKDAYEATKNYLRKKFGEDSEAAKALELATEKPESPARKALLVEEAAQLETDPELLRLIANLAALLPPNAGCVRQQVHVAGRHNRVQVAARDIINTERHVQRSVITPDERHIAGAQKRKLSAVIAELADRLAGEEGKPRFGAVHKMLQQKFNVSAFALLPQERFEEALNFLKKQRAIHRSRLQRRNPATYQQDFFRVIHAQRSELDWDKPQLYQFAAEKLGLKRPITSLRELGSIQLKSLSDLLRREVTRPKS